MIIKRSDQVYRFVRYIFLVIALFALASLVVSAISQDWAGVILNAITAIMFLIVYIILQLIHRREHTILIEFGEKELYYYPFARNSMYTIPYDEILDVSIDHTSENVTLGARRFRKAILIRLKEKTKQQKRGMHEKILLKLAKNIKLGNDIAIHFHTIQGDPMVVYNEIIDRISSKPAN
jgi:hypothetical protein